MSTENIAIYIMKNTTLVWGNRNRNAKKLEHNACMLAPAARGKNDRGKGENSSNAGYKALTFNFLG